MFAAAVVGVNAYRNPCDTLTAAHDAVVALGSQVQSAPSELPEYHPGYYATFWQDPFGHLLEAVCHRVSSTPGISQTAEMATAS